MTNKNSEKNRTINNNSNHLKEVMYKSSKNCYLRKLQKKALFSINNKMPKRIWSHLK